MFGVHHFPKIMQPFFPWDSEGYSQDSEGYSQGYFCENAINVFWKVAKVKFVRDFTYFKL